jgi:thiamine-phosphate pyrophosphorylase
MSDSLQRLQLARAAARCGGDRKDLPSLALFCDDDRFSDPRLSASLLPRGAMVVVRSRDACRLVELAMNLCPVAKMRGLILLIADNGELAMSLGCGLHLPEAHAGQIARWRALCPATPVTVAAHSLAALARASLLGADAAFLSPVFSTASHPGSTGLGVCRANLIAHQTPLPVYALGGINAQSVSRLSGFAGAAAIGALI